MERAFPSIAMKKFLIVGLILSIATGVTEAWRMQTNTVGVSYGMLVSNLPSPQQVVGLLRANRITKMRIYNGNEDMLSALRNTNIEVIIGVMNEEMAQVSSTKSAARAWVQRHVVTFYPSTRITHISVGNEVFINKQFLSYLLPAMRAIQSAINAVGLGGKVLVSTAHPDSVITDFYPPSKAKFDQDIRSDMRNVLRFLKKNGSPFMVHIHPYFAHTRSNGFVSLDYALFTSRSTVVNDGGARKGYSNVFDAIHDSMVFAMEDVGVHGIPILVDETGWPTSGGEAANVENAMTYNRNFIRHARINNINAFLFSLYDEDITRERFDPTEARFGLFHTDSSPVYPLRFSL